MKSVPKTSVNPFFNSKYATLDAVWETIRKPLSDNGLSVAQTIALVEGEISLETTLFHTSGQWIQSSLPINAKTNEPQVVGSAITYARKYSVSAILGISSDDDDDAEHAMARDNPASKPAAKAQPSDNRYRCPDPEHGGAIWTKKTGKDGKSWHSHKQGNGWCNMKDAKLDADDPSTQPQEGTQDAQQALSKPTDAPMLVDDREGRHFESEVELRAAIYDAGWTNTECIKALGGHLTGFLAGGGTLDGAWGILSKALGETGKAAP